MLTKISYKKIARFLLLTILILNVDFLTSQKADAAEINCKISDSKCYENYFISLIKKGSTIENTLREFQRVSKSTNGINGQCNNIGRSIGKSLYLKYGDEVLKYHDLTCGEPYAYGFMAEMGAKDRSLKLIDKLVKYCREDSSVGMCAYGVGISQSKNIIDAGIIQKICEYNFKPSKFELTLPYEVRAEGICLLGWVSGRNNVLPSTYFTSIKSAEKICDNTNNEGRVACLGEATFAYTYIGNPNSEVRIKRIYELKERCKKDASSTCYRFVGKALDDHFLYSLNINLDDIKTKNQVKNLVSELCSLKSNFCLEGMINAHNVHRGKDDSRKLCATLDKKFVSICMNIVDGKVEVK